MLKNDDYIITRNNIENYKKRFYQEFFCEECKSYIKFNMQKYKYANAPWWKIFAYRGLLAKCPICETENKWTVPGDGLP